MNVMEKTDVGGGSSPLARGLRAHHDRRLCGGRIIPARAGFTTAASTRSTLIRDHPRSRGVYPPRWRSRGRSGGSSPLARGLPRGRGMGRSKARIIPARAGFTESRAWGERRVWDHPRSRGVYPCLPHPHMHLRGSSPLARGLPAALLGLLALARIIPARAGFTEWLRGRRRGTGDHPRSRGVYAVLAVLDRKGTGSSPLARGLRREGRRDRHGGRIIPARAGFTTPTGSTGSWPRDHPRSRGVYIRPRLSFFLCLGSSPLARGLPGQPLLRGGRGRIIPARAGFTFNTHPL